jgi:predicted extracellular nuclease
MKNSDNMKIVKPYALVVLLAIMGISGAWMQAKPEKKIKLKTYHGSSVVFYNVENLFDTIDDANVIDEEFLPSGKLKWTSDRYLKKLDHIVEALLLNQPQNPMLIGFVEVENYKVVADVSKTGRLAQTKYQVAHKESPDARGIDCALLYDSERFKPLVIMNLAVQLDSVPNFKTRDILYVKGELAGKKQLHVFVNHWPSRREGEKESEHKRRRAAEVARKKIDEILKDDPKANIVLMGDFNDHPNNASLDQVLKAKPVTDLSADLVNLLYDDHAAGKGTHNFKGQWGVLDQFIVSSALYKGKKGVAIQGQDAKIVYEEILLFTQKDGSKKPSTTYGGPNYYGGYSDHLPITFTFK